MVNAAPILMDTPSSAPAKSSAYKPTVRLSPASVPSAPVPGAAAAPIGETLVDISHLDFFYNTSQALHDINLEAAKLLLRLKPDVVTVQSCILHDVIEDTPKTEADVEKHFGKDVAEICQ